VTNSKCEEIETGSSESGDGMPTNLHVAGKPAAAHRDCCRSMTNAAHRDEVDTLQVNMAENGMRLTLPGTRSTCQTTAAAGLKAAENDSGFFTIGNNPKIRFHGDPKNVIIHTTKEKASGKGSGTCGACNGTRWIVGFEPVASVNNLSN